MHDGVNVREAGLKELVHSREQYVHWARENNFEKGLRRLLTDLYPDNAHFIYELLQNAEDARDPSNPESKGARIVRFTLTEQEVDVEHDGSRLFTLENVEAITSIGNTTKRDDPTAIGKFGVGFKAVFAYTDSPEVRSGSYHFRIRDLFVPVLIPDEGLRLELGTRFRFPFNHSDKSPARAVAEVAHGLRNLGDNTLLFLQHVRCIEYILPDGAYGCLKREDKEDGIIEIACEHPGAQPRISRWLRFEKAVEVADENGIAKSCRVAIAFGLKTEPVKEGGPMVTKIVPVDGQVSIFFPAEKETSLLRFHVHAPFASTVARDSIRTCDANNVLRGAIADLIAEALPSIRDMGFLTVEFLATLPVPQDRLTNFYEPIRQRIVREFSTAELTPTRKGGHQKSTGLYAGPARIAEVITDDDLSYLTNFEPPLWAANASQQQSREQQFLDSLGIDSWTWDELASTFNDIADDKRESMEMWLAGKPDPWMLRLYALLGECADAPHYNSIYPDSLKIVRVAQGESDLHLSASEVFFPVDSDETDLTEPPAGVHYVKPSVYTGGRSEMQRKLARSFLQSAGVKTYDERAVIELRLRCYPHDAPKQIGSTYFRELRKFVAYWKSNPKAVDIFRGVPFLVGVADGERSWLTAGALCLDEPFQDTGLSSFLPVVKRRLLWDGYAEEFKGDGLASFIAFVVALGTKSRLTVERTSISRENKHRDTLLTDFFKAGVRESAYTINQDYWIDNLMSYLNPQSIVGSRLVWDAVTRAEPAAAVARYRANAQYRVREADSKLVQVLRGASWVPTKGGEFRVPQDVSEEELHPDFPFLANNGMLAKIGFAEHARRRSVEYQSRTAEARNMGFASAEEAESIAAVVRESGFTPEEVIDLVNKHRRATQPEGAIRNPERRRRVVLEERSNAPQKESVKRERSVQVGAQEDTLQARAYLRAKYMNVDRDLVCQLCGSVMPFKVEGLHFFEAVQCVRGLPQRFYENRLALCPNCAAMYQYARQTDPDEIQRRIVDAAVDDDVTSVGVIVKLAGEDRQIRFVAEHWLDLKTLLDEPPDALAAASAP